MGVLSNLEPKKVFYYFEEITKIPHGSGNVEQISDFLVDFAKAHKLFYIQDAMKNIKLPENPIFITEKYGLSVTTQFSSTPDQ